jgi:hypothetical protein
LDSSGFKFIRNSQSVIWNRFVHSLSGQQDPPEQGLAGETDHRLGCVPLALVDQLVTGRQPKRVLDPGIQSASAWRTYSRVRPLGLDCGMRFRP